MTTDSFWFIIFFGEKIRFPVNSFNDYITGDYMNEKQDLTVGSIPQKIIYLSMPILATSFINMAYNFIDMICIGRLGSGAVAAVGSAGFLMWFAQASSSIARIGAQITISQSMGRKDLDMARQYAQASMWLNSFIAWAFTIFIMIFNEQIIGYFRLGDPQIIMQGRIYLVIVGLAMVFAYTTPVLSAMFNASGDSKTPFLFNTCGLIFNIVFDILLIFGIGPFPKLGVAGAAIATAGAQALVWLLFILHIKKYPQPHLNIRIFSRPDFAKIKEIAKIGFPSSLQSTLYCVFSIMLARIISHFGATEIAVQKVGSQIESLSWITADGFAIALCAFVGQNFGSRNFNRIDKGIRIIAMMSIFLGAIATIGLVFFGEPIFRVFIDEPQSIPSGVNYLRILGYSQIPMCIEIITIGMFNGFGETKIPAVISILLTGARIPMALFFTSTALGVNGVWWAISLSSIVKGSVLPVFYYLYRKKMVLEA